MFELGIVLTAIITGCSAVVIGVCLATHPKFLMWLNKEKTMRKRNKINEKIKNRYKKD